MRILWFSNRAFSDRAATDSGTWLSALGDALATSDEVELCNITFGDGALPERRDHGRIRQWLLPRSALAAEGMPSAHALAAVTDEVSRLAPDVVHVWGTESFWGLLTARGAIRGPSLLEIQGLREPCIPVYWGGLNARDRLACLGPREILRPHNSISAERATNLRWGRREREIIAGHRFIVTPSPWAEDWAREINGKAEYAHADLPLRPAFYAAEPWAVSPPRQNVFCSAAYLAPFKGVHDAIRSFALLRRDLPAARLRIAGAVPRITGLRREGYAAWLRRLSARLGVADAVDWLGALPGDALVRELQSCGAMVMPSYCESYCMALAEALYLGVPAVTTRVGGTEWLAGAGPSALFFAPGDVAECAAQLQRVLSDADLAAGLSQTARSAALGRHDLGHLVADQLARYRKASTMPMRQ
jgi:glycosyltransferase involved in cell wall biosynthesis